MRRKSRILLCFAVLWVLGIAYYFYSGTTLSRKVGSAFLDCLFWFQSVSLYARILWFGWALQDKARRCFNSPSSDLGKWYTSAMLWDTWWKACYISMYGHWFGWKSISTGAPRQQCWPVCMRGNPAVTCDCRQWEWFHGGAGQQFNNLIAWTQFYS